MTKICNYFMAALCNRAGHIYFHPVVCSSSFFPQRSEIRCLPYFHTWCGLSANLGCRSGAARGSLEMQDAKMRQKVAVCVPSKSCVLLYCQCDCTALEQRPSAKHCGVVYKEWNYRTFAEGATYILLVLSFLADWMSTILLHMVWP